MSETSLKPVIDKLEIYFQNSMKSSTAGNFKRQLSQ